jgi:hypothetical protein
VDRRFEFPPLPATRYREPVDALEEYPQLEEAVNKVEPCRAGRLEVARASAVGAGAVYFSLDGRPGACAEQLYIKNDIHWTAAATVSNYAFLAPKLAPLLNPLGPADRGMNGARCGPSVKA